MENVEPHCFLIAARKCSLVATIGKLSFPRVVDTIGEICSGESDSAFPAFIFNCSGPDFPKDSSPRYRIRFQILNELFHIEVGIFQVISNLSTISVYLDCCVI